MTRLAPPRYSLALLFLAATALPAQAQVFVAGDGRAQGCFMAAKTGDQGSTSAIRTCTGALDDMITRSDRAATHVNRGVLYMRAGEYERADADLARALELDADLPEAHINRGAVLYYLGEDARALAALDTAIEAGTNKEAIARFNRALVHERMGDAKSAYYDLKRAVELEPDWEQARDSLSRFTVTKAG